MQVTQDVIAWEPTCETPYQPVSMTVVHSSLGAFIPRCTSKLFLANRTEASLYVIEMPPHRLREPILPGYRPEPECLSACLLSCRFLPHYISNGWNHSKPTRFLRIPSFSRALHTRSFNAGVVTPCSTASSIHVAP